MIGLIGGDLYGNAEGDFTPTPANPVPVFSRLSAGSLLAFAAGLAITRAEPIGKSFSWWIANYKKKTEFSKWALTYSDFPVGSYQSTHAEAAMLASNLVWSGDSEGNIRDDLIRLMVPLHHTEACVHWSWIYLKSCLILKSSRSPEFVQEWLRGARVTLPISAGEPIGSGAGDSHIKHVVPAAIACGLQSTSFADAVIKAKRTQLSPGPVCALAGMIGELIHGVTEHQAALIRLKLDSNQRDALRQITRGRIITPKPTGSKSIIVRMFS